MKGNISIHLYPPLEGDMSVSIKLNQIIVDFKATERVSNLNTLRNVVAEAVSTIVDCAGINSAVGYTVDIRTVYDIQGQTDHVFGAREAIFPIEERGFRQTDISEMLKVCYNSHVQLALSDFKYAIFCPKDTGLFCYRAFESLVCLIMKEEKINNKKSAMKKLSDIINVTEENFNFLRKLNISIRHGSPGWISGEDRTLALQITREIVLRFIFYLNNQKGSKPAFENFNFVG